MSSNIIVFDRQEETYRDRELLPALPGITVAAGVCDIWRKHIGRAGGFFCFLGFTPERAACERFHTSMRVRWPTTTGGEFRWLK
jgi:hypothetical protein